jgi:signal peptidase
MRRIVNLVTAVFIILTVTAWGLPHLGFPSYFILSDSMKPVLRQGNAVIINTHDREVAPGEVIAFRMGEATIVHRVMTVSEEGIVTKGDDNASLDPGIRQQEDVIGTLALSLGSISPLLGLLTSQWRWLIIAILVALNILTDAIPFPDQDPAMM